MALVEGGRRQRHSVHRGEKFTRINALALALATIGAVVVGVSASPSAVAADTATVSCTDSRQSATPVHPEMAGYTPLPTGPRRIVDTREGLGGHQGVVAAGCTMRLDMVASAVPASAGAVALSVTAVTGERGFVTAFPCSSGRPTPSNLNSRGDIPTSNLVIAVPDENREVCLYVHVAMDLVIDLQGWWGEGGDGFAPIDPVRALDTRELPGRPPLPSGAIRDIKVAGTHVPSDATSVVVNLTVTETSDRGWIVAYPCGEAAPTASNLNYLGGDTRAVAAVVKVGHRNGGQGSICVKTLTTTHLIVDVVGYYAPSFGPSAALRPAQQRLVDTRDSTGPWDRPFRKGETRELDPLAGLSGAADATAVVINAVGVNPVERGFLSFYPCGGERPTGSTLNTLPGRSVANLLTVKLSATGTVCVYAHTATDVVLDLVATMDLPDGSPVRQLSIDGAAVYPRFAPTGHDYAVRCGAGTNTLGVRVAAQRTGRLYIDGVEVGNGVRRAITAVADDVFTVDVVRSGQAPVRYNFRCLPADFPNLIVDQSGATAPGWYVTGLGGTGGAGSFAVILDERGAPIWYRRTERSPINVQRLTNGTILYDQVDLGGYGVYPDEVATNITLDGSLVGEITTDDPTTFPLDHHELLEREDGWTAVAYELVEHVDLTDLGPGYTADEWAVDGTIREIVKTPPFSLEWEWTASDSFDIAEVQYPVRFKNFLPNDPQGEVDLFHLNSVEAVDDDSGDYIVSAWHLDAVFRVDHATKQVEWILASTPTNGVVIPNKDGAQRLAILGDPLGGPRREHDARLDGDILTLFDNRKDTGQPARAVAYRIDVGAGTATWLWQIDEPFGRSSGGLGSTRVTPDGSILVDWGGLQPMFNEFDAQGNLLLSIEQSPTGNAYRIVKYAADAFDVDELRALAGSDGPGA